MLDRESTFADAELVRMLRADFVPVAIDQACQRRQQDAEGEFYRRFSGQSPRHDFSQTTQGFYVATAAGELLLYNNNRDPAKVRRLVAEALEAREAFVTSATKTVMPVVSIDGKPIGNGHPGSTAAALREAFFDVAEKTPA